MAKFGAFQINRACGISHGGDPVVELALEPGRYEPQSGEELDALLHLSTVPMDEPVRDETGNVVTPGESFASQVEAPDVTEPAPVAGPVSDEPLLPEPPSAPAEVHDAEETSKEA